MDCLICTRKVSKKDKKLIKACRTSGMAVLDLCSTCVLSHNKVLAKMKKGQRY